MYFYSMPPERPLPEFSLNAVEADSRENWINKHRKKCRMGHGVAHTFTPTGVGVVISLKCLKCKKKKDITDYESW